MADTVTRNTVMGMVGVAVAFGWVGREVGVSGSAGGSEVGVGVGGAVAVGGVSVSVGVGSVVEVGSGVAVAVDSCVSVDTV